jgi:hypothetical protein
MNKNLSIIQSSIYNKCNFKVSNVIIDKESQEYDSCEFLLDGRKIIFRTSKITPKKIGQFVTFWKRNQKGITEPFFENDTIYFYVINVQSENKTVQFVFPKSVLIEKGIISTSKKDGKEVISFQKKLVNFTASIYNITFYNIHS